MKLIFVFILVIFISTNLKLVAQNEAVYSTSGEFSSGTSMSLSWTIGEPIVGLNDTSKSFLDKNDFNWFLKNPVNENIDYFKASKKYSQERNLELFKLIEMGSVISKGDLFKAISQLIQ